MSVNPDIHDKAYQFFIEEAAELLQIIEDGILELRRDRGANTVHAVMRAAHSIKGGAASVELEAIKAISHRMETAFRALYDETVEIDDELEGLLLDGFDCLKDPLNEQIETGSHDPEAALATAMPIIEELEAKLGADALKQADNFIPSSSDLGIDMVTSIFEIDVEQGITHLQEVAANPDNFPVLGELQAQAEVFVGFGELLELPGFGAIAQAILDACHNNPTDATALLNIALKDLLAARDLVMGGDREAGGAPSEALLALAGSGSAPSQESSPEANLAGGDFSDFGLSEADLANFDFGSADLGVDLANGDLSPLEIGQPSEAATPEDVTPDAALTDAGLGDFDLGALAMEGEALMGDAAAPGDEATEQPMESFDIGMDDFQALIDESSSISNSEDDELATVGQAEEADAGLGSLEDPAVAELEANQSDASAFDSLDAMAQLADLMAVPEPGHAEGEADDLIAEQIESPLVETAELETGLGLEDASLGLEEADLGLENASIELDEAGIELGDASLELDEAGIESDSPELSDVFSLDLGSEAEPSVAEASELTSTDENAEPGSSNESPEASEAFDLFASDIEPAISVEPAISAEPEAPVMEASGNSSPTEDETASIDVGLAAPDAELENMWAELDEDMGDELPASAPHDDLDNAFEIALDASDAAVEAEALVEVEDFSKALDQDVPSETDLDEIFGTDAASDGIDALEEPDVTTPLSVAEADAAFEALVDASTIEANESEQHSEDSLDLSFDNDLDPVNPTAELEPPAVEQAAAELASSEQPESEQLESEQPSDTDNFFDDLTPLAEVEPTAKAMDVSDEPAELGDMLTPDSLEKEQLTDPWSSLNAEETEATASEAEASSSSSEEEAPEPLLDSPATDEWIEEGTFVQSMDMGTVVQPHENLSSHPEVPTADSIDEASEEAENNLPLATMAAEQPAEQPADWSESDTASSEPQASESIPDGTFIQGIDEGTFIQGIDDDNLTQGFSAPVESVDQVEPKTVESTTYEIVPPATTPSAPTESFDESTFVQSFEDGTFIQGISDAAMPSLETAMTDDSDVESTDDEASSVESFDEGTFVQSIDEGTFVQGISDAAMPAPGETADNNDVESNATNDAASSVESFDEGTFVQNIDEGTFVQGISDAAMPAPGEAADNSDFESNAVNDAASSVESIDEGTFVQGVTDAVPQGETVPAAFDQDDAWEDTSAEESSSEREEALIPELQAFIAQAAAESANADRNRSSNLAAPDSTSPAPENLDSIAAPEAAEPEAVVAETVEPEPAGTGLTHGSGVSDNEDKPEAVATEAVAEQPDSEEAAEVNVEVEAQEKAAEDKTAGDKGTGDNKTDQEGQSDAGPHLPSLETMFAVAPEQLAAIANDSLTAELMEPEELATYKSIQAKAKATKESDESEADAPAPEVAPTSNPADSTPATPQTHAAVEVALAEHQAESQASNKSVTHDPQQGKESSLNAAVQAVEQMFGQLPTNNQLPVVQPQATTKASSDETPESDAAKAKKKKRQQGTKLSGISVRVDLSVLERMNNLVGELVLSRNSLSLQHEQLQSVVTQLDKRFNNFEGQLNGLRGISDQMLVEPAQRQAANAQASPAPTGANPGEDSNGEEGSLLEGFDVLEMDRYSALHGQLQEIFEQLMQLEEGVDDIGVLLEQSTQSLTQQRQRLGLLQNELMWARMLPLDNILGRFPRVLRDMARKHGKSVDLNMNGTSVLVDKGMLEKLHDPMLHLLRNAFDHGIEKPDQRKQQGKSERGEIQINAYYQGNQTVIEIKDDGQGVNLERIAKRAVELEWLSREEVKAMPQQTLLDLIFEPGFSTAAKLSELSGRGVGLDVVREQIKGLKGNVTVDFEKDKGTTFTLRLPLTLTVAKLMVCQVGSTVIALPSDGIEDLLVPQPEQLKMVGTKRLLHWRDDLIPIQSMTELLDYSCPTADIASLKSITSKSIPVPKDWALPLLIFSRGSQRCAMEVNRLLMEQELVIKPFSSAMSPPEYSYGCTILGDGRMIPVLDGTALLQQLSDNSMAVAAGVEINDDLLGEDEAINDGTDVSATMAQAMQTDTILVVDDSTAMRRTMALSLEKAGYRVLQAGDGQEALTQLRQSSAIQLVICDVEMPNMNGFEFLSQRRREPALMKIPVVMLTSRSSDKHRRLAMQLNAHDYFSKPYVEQEFLKSIKTILSKQSAKV